LPHRILPVKVLPFSACRQRAKPIDTSSTIIVFNWSELTSSTLWTIELRRPHRPISLCKNYQFAISNLRCLLCGQMANRTGPPWGRITWFRVQPERQSCISLIDQVEEGLALLLSAFWHRIVVMTDRFWPFAASHRFTKCNPKNVGFCTGASASACRPRCPTLSG